MSDRNGIFDRTERLVGKSVMEHLADIRVLVVGVGGVGSWCAEGLVRSGVCRITIADPDSVCLSNVNRQLMATLRTIGESKVSALRERLLAINPEADITARCERFCQESEASFHLEDYDYIIDAIDNIPDKARLILAALNTDAVLFSSMGAALKMDPSRISVREFWKVTGCPLARALRNRFKKSGCYPKRKFLCVFSEERLENIPSDYTGDTGNGSVVHITATFGFRLSALVLEDAITFCSGSV